MERKVSGAELSDIQMIEDFVRGCTFYATGGGGLPLNGIESLSSELRTGRVPGWISIESLDDDSTVACPFLMGSIAPHTQSVIDEMKSFGFSKETSRFSEKERMARALEVLESFSNKKIDAVIPIELAGANTSAALSAASMIGKLTIDGDFAGRAIPEILQTTPCLDGIPLLPISSVDEWGNVTLITESTGDRVTERLGKLISSGGYGLAGQAGFLMTGAQAKRVIIPGTLTQSLKLGRFIRKVCHDQKNGPAALADFLGAQILFSGKVILKDDEDKLGYYWGKTHIQGITNDGNEGRAAIWFKNENHVLWINDKPIVTSPELICIVDSETAEPIPNPLLQQGQIVTVLACPAPKQLTTPEAISVLGPRYFGFDFDHIPMS